MSLNPVLPPPRKILDPVRAVLVARSASDLRRHFARWKRAVQYAWTQDTSYTGKMGGKWVDGDRVRYQKNKPGDEKGKGGAVADLRRVHGQHDEGKQKLKDALRARVERLKATYRKVAEDVRKESNGENWEEVREELREAFLADLQELREKSRGEYESLKGKSSAQQQSVRERRDAKAERIWMDVSLYFKVFTEDPEGVLDESHWGDEVPESFADVQEWLGLLGEHSRDFIDPADVEYNAEKLMNALEATADEARAMGREEEAEELEGYAEWASQLAQAGEQLRKLKVSDVRKTLKHYARINPVLPPPRRLLLYGWEPAEGYVGKTKKWIGTGDDAGKKPRYQDAKPGTGRGGKKTEGSPPAKTPGKTPTEPAKKAPAKRGGGKPPVDLEALKQVVADARAGKGDREKAKEVLRSLTSDQLDQLKKLLNIKGGGRTKAEKQETLVGGGKEKPKEKKTEKTKEPWGMTRKEWSGGFNGRGGRDEFIRFGGMPKGGKSLNNIDDVLEDGVSAFRLEEDDDGPYFNPAGSGTDWFEGRTVYLVRGNEIGTGSDGEPLFDPDTAKTTARLEIYRDKKDKRKWRFKEISHQDVIEAAITRGKPVPPEVLADYPDLAEKYGQKPQEKPAGRKPAATKQRPKEGDTNAQGLVFQGGRWRRKTGEKKPEAGKVPSAEEFENAEYTPLGNETGNMELLQATVGGEEYVVKPTQRRNGPEVENRASNLARELGLNAIEVVPVPEPRKSNIRGNWKGWSNDGAEWVATKKVAGSPLEESEVAEHADAIAADALVSYALGCNDRNLGNLLKGLDGEIAFIDWEPSFSEDLGIGGYVAADIPPETKLDPGILRRILAKKDDIIRAANQTTGDVGFNGKENDGKPMGRYAQVRLDALEELSRMKSPTMGDLLAIQAKLPGEKTPTPGAGPADKPPLSVPPEPSQEKKPARKKKGIGVRWDDEDGEPEPEPKPEPAPEKKEESPYEPKNTPEEIRWLHNYANGGGGNYNPRGYRGMPEGVDVSAATEETLKEIDAENKRSGGFSRARIDRVYEAVAKKIPGMTLGKFHQMLVELHRQKVIHLGAYTGLTAYNVPDEQLLTMIPLDGERRFYLTAGSNRKAEASPTPGAGPADKPPLSVPPEPSMDPRNQRSTSGMGKAPTGEALEKLRTQKAAMATKKAPPPASAPAPVPRQPTPTPPPESQKRVSQHGAKPTEKQVNFVLSLLSRHGYGTRFMNSKFKDIGASMRERSGSVKDWLNGMSRGEMSELIDRIQKRHGG